jgi:hypothetical protein
VSARSTSIVDAVDMQLHRHGSAKERARSEACCSLVMPELSGILTLEQREYVILTARRFVLASRQATTVPAPAADMAVKAPLRAGSNLFGGTLANYRRCYIEWLTDPQGLKSLTKCPRKHTSCFWAKASAPMIIKPSRTSPATIFFVMIT